MEKPESCKKVLEEILSSRDFGRLVSFTQAKKWKEMVKEDRELLGILFVMKGEEELNNGDSRALKSFQLANTIIPNSPLVMHRQALAFANQYHNIFCLKAACKIFKKIVQIKDNFFDAWHCWGNALVLLGIFSDEFEYYQEALKKFLQAEAFSQKVSQVKLGQFYRDWGMCWYYLGKASGEPMDFRYSIHRFDDAIKNGMSTCEFWNDYGNSLLELSFLTTKSELLIEALESYWLAVKIDPNDYNGWINYAATLSRLYQMHPQSVRFDLAYESFEQAANLQPQNFNVWLKWGQLLTFRGKKMRDLKDLQESCKKFERADQCESNHPLVLSSWAESLLLLGSLTDDFSLLCQAKKKIIKCLEIQPDQSRLWCLYGNCLYELGRYFGEEKTYIEAIEKFRYGLKLNPQDYLLWYGLGMAYFGIAQLRDDVELIEDSAQFFVKVIEHGGQSLPKFWNDWGCLLMALAQRTDEKEHIEGAIGKFEQALRLQAGMIKDAEEELIDPEWLYNYGCALEFLAEHEESIPCYEKANKVLKRVLEFDPAYYPVHYNIASILTQLGTLTGDVDCHYEAIDHLQRYLEADSEDDHVWDEWGVALLNLAQIIHDPVQPDIAQKLFIEAENKFLYAIALGNTFAFYHLACLCSIRGKYADGMHYLERARQHHALPSIDDLLHDKWLEGVRQTPGFRHFLSHL